MKNIELVNTRGKRRGGGSEPGGEKKKAPL